MEINFNDLTPQGSRSKTKSKPVYAIKYARNNSVKNPYEHVVFTTQAMDKYGFTDGNGLQFYGVVNGSLLVATCPEADAKKMHGGRLKDKENGKKVNYFKYDKFNTDLINLGYVPKEGDCEVGLEFTLTTINGAPEGYTFYTVTPIIVDENLDDDTPVPMNLLGDDDDPDFLEAEKITEQHMLNAMAEEADQSAKEKEVPQSPGPNSGHSTSSMNSGDF